MWKYYLMSVAGWMMMAMAVCAEGTAVEATVPAVPAAEAAPESRTPVVLCRVGDLDDALMDRLKNWAESQLAVAVPLGETLAVESDKLQDVVPQAVERLEKDGVGMVVLDAQASADEPHGIFRPEERVVVINVTDMKEGADPEILARRLERQVIRGIALLVGLEWSPNPESAMAEYSTLEELDRMGRNMDPPWLLKFQERARALGLPLDPDNPVNFLRE